MPTPTVITDLSQTAASNYPAGTDSPSVLDDVQRAHAAFIALLRDGKGQSSAQTIAGGATTDIGGVNSQFVEVTGTPIITSFGTNYTGVRFARFTGAAVITHNATLINLPGAANITTASGDCLVAVPNSTGNGWNVTSYQRAATAPDFATNASVAAAIAALILVPPGTVMHTAASTAPSGYIKANGGAVSRTTYAALFGAIGTIYGAGDGSTTFNVPDLRGEFVRGWDDARGVDSGRGFGTAQSDAFQGHGHTAASLFGGTQVPSYGAGAPISIGSQATPLGPIPDGVNGTPRVGSETRPRNIALLACIKY